MSDHWEVGQMLEHARAAKGLSQRAAAARAEISASRWRQIEMGFEVIDGVRVPVKVRKRTLLAVADAVGLAWGDVLPAARRTNQVIFPKPRKAMDDPGANRPRPAR